MKKTNATPKIITNDEPTAEDKHAAEVKQMAEVLRAVEPARFVRIERLADPELQMFEVHYPIKLDGSPDPTRTVRVFTTIMLNYENQRMEQRLEIIADSLEEAINEFQIQAAEIGVLALQKMADADAARKLLMSANEGGAPN